MDAAPAGAGEPYSVCVVGAGGVGALFAARLAAAGLTVHCIARGAHLAAIQRRGIVVKSFAGDATARTARPYCAKALASDARFCTRAPQVRVASATTSPAEVGVVDLVIVALKAWQLDDLDLRPLVRTGPDLSVRLWLQRRTCAAPLPWSLSTACTHFRHRAPGEYRAARAKAVRSLAPKVGPRTLVMPTQNGVDAPERLGALLGAAHVVGGYTRVTSLLQGAGGVNHTAIHPAVQGTGALPTSGDWVPAELQRCATAWNVRARKQLQQLPPRCAACQALRSRLFETHTRPRPQRSPYMHLQVDDDVLLNMWRKLTVMAAYSAVCSTARCPIGPVLASPDSRAVLVSCMQETAAVARACGAAMRDADVDACCAVLAGLPPGCTPSMQRDILAGRPSELDDQAGAVVRIGAARGVPTPLLGALHALLQPQERCARGKLTMPAMVEGGGSDTPLLEYHI
jgi:2-dehydropantoate 2-reductase